ncbi:MAG TPA: hypothetical protein VKP04_03245, partial [Ktedonobacteraceae bacterium]|nr:hypothetical protein [Ktedonobacteraceae bacterium]
PDGEIADSLGPNLGDVVGVLDEGIGAVGAIACRVDGGRGVLHTARAPQQVKVVPQRAAAGDVAEHASISIVSDGVGAAIGIADAGGSPQAIVEGRGGGTAHHLVGLGRLVGDGDLDGFAQQVVSE